MRPVEGQLCLRDARSLCSHVRNNEEVIEGGQREGTARKGRTREKDGASLEIILTIRAFDHDREVVLRAKIGNITRMRNGPYIV